MQGDILGNLQAWIVSVLVYPGLLFGVGVALGVEWVVGAVKPRLSPAVYRIFTRPPHPMQPLFSFLKLAGRRGPSGLAPEGNHDSASRYDALAYVALAGAAAPLLALALTPLGGNPVMRAGGIGDLALVLLLLAVQPLLRALALLLMGGLSALEGARGLGRLITGLVPTLIAVAALVEASGQRTFSLSQLGAAPESGGQFFVRLLAGAALLAALPWWLDPHTGSSETAGSLAGRHLQGVALGALWAALVVPVAGDPVWAVLLSVIATLLATLVMRLITLLWAPLRAKREAAGMAWRTALPVAALALFVSLWAGA